MMLLPGIGTYFLSAAYPAVNENPGPVALADLLSAAYPAVNWTACAASRLQFLSAAYPAVNSEFSP